MPSGSMAAVKRMYNTVACKSSLQLKFAFALWTHGMAVKLITDPCQCEGPLIGVCRSSPLSRTDHAVRLCKRLLAGDAVIGMIRFTSARQRSDGRLHRQPHVDERFLSCCN
jgi:hypothetical protein